ncbi:hypothetical protein, partial [Moorena sp. SIO3I6]|uniref:hypothetical protein n=1 Tax=Moorena sp. SIO3I6 TaxID=2607831 RepID=UPI0013F8928F
MKNENRVLNKTFIKCFRFCLLTTVIPGFVPIYVFALPLYQVDKQTEASLYSESKPYFLTQSLEKWPDLCLSRLRRNFPDAFHLQNQSHQSTQSETRTSENQLQLNRDYLVHTGSFKTLKLAEYSGVTSIKASYAKEFIQFLNQGILLLTNDTGKLPNLTELHNCIDTFNRVLNSAFNIYIEEKKYLEPKYFEFKDIILREVTEDGTAVLEVSGKVVENIELYFLNKNGEYVQGSPELIQALNA